MTVGLTATYSLCNPSFRYLSSANPRRVLTKPSQGVANYNYDNINADLILYVNDVLGLQQKPKCDMPSLATQTKIYPI
jgi:dual specificity protein kinase YAK1